MGRRKKQEESSGGASWLTTYSDLVTLLLCFFILLFSMAIVDKQKFEKVRLSMRSAFLGGGELIQDSGDAVISLTPYDNKEDIFDQPDDGTGQEGNEGEDVGIEDDDGQTDEENDAAGDDDKTGQTDAHDVEDTDQRLESIKTVQSDIQGLIDRMGLNENIKVIDEKTMIILRMDSIILFDTGSAELKASARPVIEKIGTILRALDTDIQVQGHADDRPINTPEFQSNWELSTKRATNVVKFLVDKCDIDEKYLTATGNAEFRPIAPNDSEYNRQKNRRIDIAILK